MKGRRNIAEMERNMNGKRVLRNIFIGLIFTCLAVVGAWAQTTGFSYQGKLNNNGAAANGLYEVQFKLFDAAADGTQIGAVIIKSDVAVTDGIFTTTLDFGAAAFDGAARFLEIGVRPAGDNNPFTILSPRSPINSTPYSVRAVNAALADNSNRLGGIEASEYVTTATVGSSFINNASTLQTANFNISGNGWVGGNLGIGTTTPTSKLQVQAAGYGITQTNGAVTVGSYITTAGGGSGWFGTRSNHPLNFFANDSLARMTLTPAGNVGIGTTAPTYPLEVNGNALFTPGGSGGVIQFGTPNTETGMSIAGLIGRADVRYDGTTLKLVVNSGGGPPSSLNGITINNTGRVGIGTNTPQAKFNVVGTSWFQGDTTPLPATAGKGVLIGFSGEFGYVSAFDYGAFVPKNLLLNLGGGNVGIGTTNPQAKLDVAGTMKANILQITGGSDLAEKFEVAEAVKVFKNGQVVGAIEVKMGMVMAIDPRQAGKLVVSRAAYNRRVAGVVSGANNLSAGLLLPNLTDAKDAQPIALSGRVWVYADATRNPIAPGDLLTTSRTPGHAMKVTNYMRAQGAIIGKAMSALKSGRGLVLVLVTLQ
jgi:hypothetical protein